MADDPDFKHWMFDMEEEQDYVYLTVKHMKRGKALERMLKLQRKYWRRKRQCPPSEDDLFH